MTAEEVVIVSGGLVSFCTFKCICRSYSVLLIAINSAIIHSHVRDDVESSSVSGVVLSVRGRGQLTVSNSAVLQSERR